MLQTESESPLKSFWLALGFLTSIPAPQINFRNADLGRAARWFPLVGLLIGVLLGLVQVLLGYVFPPLLVAALTVALWVALTGGLHLDGLADCCDGLLASVPPARRLEIMHDSRVGAFGSIGLTLFLILKVTAVAAIIHSDGAVLSLSGRVLPLVLAATLARWFILPIARQPSARFNGLAVDFATGLRPATLLWAALVPLALIVFSGERAFWAACSALLVAFALAWLARSRLGGVSGDVLGLTVELTELSVLLVYVMQPAQ